MYSYSHLHSCIHKHKITISPIHSPHRTNKRSINAVIRLFLLYCLSISLSMFEKLTCVYLVTIKIIAERSCECCLQRMNTCGYLLFFSINVFFFLTSSPTAMCSYLPDNQSFVRKCSANYMTAKQQEAGHTQCIRISQVRQ